MVERLRALYAAPPDALFSGRDLARIIWPLILEQTLSMTIGMADTAMVTRVSAAALSGVSLVDSINVVLIQLFSALATGGAVVASQYLGQGTRERARDSGRQLYVLCLLLALGISIITLAARGPLLTLIYGSIEPDVMASAQEYFLLTALSYPFLALYNSGAALYRSMGKTRVTLLISIVMNLINVAGNAITIYGMGMGAAGAGLATLVSRIVGGIAITWLLRNPAHSLCVRSYSLRLDGDMVGRILRIGVPSGLENSMFSFGKLLVASLVSSLGTAAIAANAVGNNLAIMQNMPGIAINLAIVTVVGRVMGAGQYSEARRYTRILMTLIYACNWALNIPMIIFAEPLVELFGLGAESVPDAVWIVVFHGAWALFTWPLSFALPNTLRAAGDVRYTMIVSVVSMWVFRVLLSYVLAWYGLGLKAVWIAMITDWAVRGAFFVYRYMGNKWLSKKVV
ncbi:MAG: MATE family efflux transporter [Candidatus Fimadaptatus sp.]|jgi:putative MATE family efflux protein